MPTWKLKNNEETLFYHICSECDKELATGLLKGGWIKIRDVEPVSCNECTRKCDLTAKGLWGEKDAVRYNICTTCQELDECPLKGRYYC